MTTTLSSESANWILPSVPTTLISTIPNYEESLPIRVNHDGIQNYIKNRGTLNLTKWAIEGKKMSTEHDSFPVPPPKVFGSDAMRNYTQSRGSAPNLIYGNLDPPNPHHHFRVKKEGRANYDRNHHTHMKTLLESYGKLPVPAQPMPHIKGEMASNLFYTHQKGHMGQIINNYGNLPLSPKPVPHVKGDAAEMNLRNSYGHSHILEHNIHNRPSSVEPHVKGIQAHLNYDMGRGRLVDKLFHEYGKLPRSARAAPKVKFDGVQNFNQAQGIAMRKTISQCPPSNRHLERSQSVLS
ncbi:unnamed protein product [Rotaria sordida]|uniref:Uncharacterized protein n=1 Tax=Rotaria sordida TaxID=392033 RepID=A0A814G5G3_9BILA|nr:unnamed protein product [Rotaria sordida]CAF0992017.1 unnamed protein product [Rotaria sordida]CAF3692236.1 unnamed protein product [Rotaria sordida]CAF3842702.1 unnamed protein product [Rotaria sordida]